MLGILCAGATLAGVGMFSTKNQHESAQPQIAELKSQLSALQRENAELRDHNARLKALVIADAPVDLPEGTLEFVEGTLGFEFSEAPLAFNRSEEILEEAASQFWVAEIGHDPMLARNFALEALGVLPPMSDLLQILTQQTYRNRIAVYDPSSHEIILDLRFDDENVHHQAQLIHACSIALMAEQLTPWHILDNDDARISQIGALYARASNVSQQFYAKASRQQGIPLQASKPNTNSSQGATQIEPVTISSFEKILEQFFQSDSHQFIHKHPRFLENPSHITSQTVLNPHIEPVTIGPKPRQEHAESGLELVTKLGVLPILSYAKSDLDREKMLASYRNDQLVISVDEDGQFTTTWMIDWANEAAASQFVKTITTPATVQVQQKHNKVTLQVHHSSAEN